jgi:hypothetical protein
MPLITAKQKARQAASAKERKHEMSRGRGCRTVKLSISTVLVDPVSGQIKNISGSIEGDRGAREDIFIRVETPDFLFDQSGKRAWP